MKRPLYLMFALSLIVACGETHDPNDPPETLTVDGKGDISSGVRNWGDIEFGGEKASEFTRDFEMHAYTISANEGAELRLDVTNRGTSRALDTNLFIYAPTDEGYVRIAKDDDSGYGEHSRIDITLRKTGDFLVVIKPEQDDARGRYRLTLECLGEDCAYQPTVDAQCPSRIEDMIHDCIIDDLNVSEGEGANWPELIEQCGSDRSMYYHEVICERGDNEWCFEDFDTFFVDQMMANCESQASDVFVVPNTLNLRLESMYYDMPRTANDCDSNTECTFNFRELRYTDSPSLEQIADSARVFSVYPSGIELEEASLDNARIDIMRTMENHLGSEFYEIDDILNPLLSLGEVTQTAKLFGYGPFGSSISMYVFYMPELNRVVTWEIILPE